MRAFVYKVIYHSVVFLTSSIDQGVMKGRCEFGVYQDVFNNMSDVHGQPVRVNRRRRPDGRSVAPCVISKKVLEVIKAEFGRRKAN